jgi:deoxycytidylate deaminase
MNSVDISYPYLPIGRSFTYVSNDNTYMQAAQAAAKASLDTAAPNGSVVVKDHRIIGQGANGSDYHKTHPCRRKELGIATGQRYDLCEGCSPKNHSEPKAIADAHAAGQDTNDADVYLWGHWWCCQPCWETMIAAGIRQVYLLKNSQKLFNKADPENILPS